MKKNRFVLILSLLVVLSIFVAGAIMHLGLKGVDVNSPSAMGNVSGTGILNASVTVNATHGAHVVNVTFRWVNVTTKRVMLNSTIHNTSTNQTEFVNSSFSTSLLPDAKYNLNVTWTNSTGSSITNTTVINITVDNTVPNVTVVGLLSGEIFTISSGNKTLNVSVADVTTNITSVVFEISNSTGNAFNVTATLQEHRPSTGEANTFYWGASYNVSVLVEGTNTVKVIAEDFVENVNKSQTADFTVDTSNPTVTSFTCNNIDVGGTQDCTCEVSDTITSVSSEISSPSTSQAGTNTATCTATDGASHTATKDATYEVIASSGGGGAGGASSGVSSSVSGKSAKRIWQSIDQGETAVVSVPNSVIGVTEISFDAKDTMYGAWVEVSKKTNLPSSVKSFSGKSYSKLQIRKSLTTKDEKISDPKIKFKVENSWLTENGLNKNQVAMFRYNDDKWNQLPTTIEKEESKYVHYTATTPGFSYFIIGQTTSAVTEAPVIEEIVKEEEKEEPAEKPVVEETPPTPEEEVVEPSQDEGMSNQTTIMIVLLILIVAGLIWWFGFRNKK